MESLQEKALIEKYGSGRTLPSDRREEIRRAQVLASLRGFCAPYPFMVPGLMEPTHGE